ncbi:MAG: envC 1 [Firmicutes bacterium]|nr:envC 1 [Bacillota bacterium]
MIRKLRYGIATLLVGVFLFSMIAPVLADEIEQRQQELGQIQEQMEAQQHRTNAAQRKVASISEQLRAIEADLAAAQKEYKSIEAKRKYTEQQIETNTEILEKTERDLAARNRILSKRMRDIYENGQVNYLDVLLGANDFTDFATRMEILKRVLNQDATLIAKVAAERQLVLEKRAALERDKAALIDLQKAAEATRQLAEKRRQERKAVLESAVYERDMAEQAYQELAEMSRQIEQMIRNIQSGRSGNAGSVGSGRMIWPLSGPITSPYGWRTHPIFGTARYHSGLDIGADYGDPILAADGGVVIYADWMGGYGNAVIIDHGRGISTLYGHNSELLVSEGQRVGKGQVIARAGSTGYSTGPHCHFEVRVNGSPTNPMDYLP